MATTTTNRLGAAAVIVGPLILAAGFLAHPYIANLTDTTATAEAAAADTARWGIAHLVVGIGSGALVLAFLAIRDFLREAGEDRWSFLAVPFIVIGGTLYAILPGMEFALIAAVDTGADVQATQAALHPWFFPTMIFAALSSAIGMIAFAVAVSRSRVLGPWSARLVVGALIVLAFARFVPLGAVQFYLQSVVVLVALWPLAYRMLALPRSANQSHAVPAT